MTILLLIEQAERVFIKLESKTNPGTMGCYDSEFPPSLLVQVHGGDNGGFLTGLGEIGMDIQA